MYKVYGLEIAILWKSEVFQIMCSFNTVLLKILAHWYTNEPDKGIQQDVGSQDPGVVRSHLKNKGKNTTHLNLKVCFKFGGTNSSKILTEIEKCNPR